MTTQAIIAGKGLTSFSETRNVASGSSISSDYKKASFDNFMSSERKGDNNVVTSDTKDAGKTIVNKLNKHDTLSTNESSFNSKDVNQLKIDVVDGEMCVTCPDNSFSQSVNIEELLEMIEEFFSEKLGVSKEVLEKILAENGINAFGLLQMDNLQNIFVQVNGIEDFSQLLTDEGLAQAWNNLVEEINNSNIEFGNMGYVEMSKLQELFENDDVIETVNDMLALKADKTDSLSDETEISEDMINNNDTLTNAKESNTAENETMLSNDETSNADVLSNAKADKGVTSTSFNESLFETFMNNVQESFEGLQKFDQGQIQQIRDVAMQIIEGVKINVKADTSSLELQLNPESLGKVQVSIEVRDGIATANFFVRDELVKTAVESQMQTLKDAFEENGLKVDKVEVSVSDFSFEQSNQTFSQEKEQKSSEKNIAGNTINITGEDALQTDMSEIAVESSEDSLIDVKA